MSTYFGVVTSDPLPADLGDTCLNTTTKTQRVYTKSGWVDQGSRFVGGSITSGGGGAVASEFEYIQGSATSVWTIKHGLGYQPSVTVIDSAGTTIVGDVQYIDANSLRVVFSFAFAGTAHLV